MNAFLPSDAFRLISHFIKSSSPETYPDKAKVATFNWADETNYWCLEIHLDEVTWVRSVSNRPGRFKATLTFQPINSITKGPPCHAYQDVTEKN
jgi:hypothetical protein